MGFIQTPVRKIMKRKLPNTQSLRKAREDYREWLKERGLDKIKPRMNNLITAVEFFTNISLLFH